MSLRRLFLPWLLGVPALVLGLLACWHLFYGSLPLWSWALALGALTLAQWQFFDHRLGKPLKQLAGEAGHDGEIAAIAARIDALEKSVGEGQKELSAAKMLRQKYETSLREIEQRFMVAMKGANDGMWEWDIASGAMYLSPRWKGMLGYGVDDIKNHIEAWKSQIHPEDRLSTERSLEAAIADKSASYEVRHRVIGHDGRYRWLLSRGTVMRNAGGKPYRVIGLDTDITQIHRMAEVLQHVAQGTAGATGEAFFRELVRHFAAVIGVRQAFITECVDYPTTRVRPLATWDSDRFIDDPEYDLKDTPCEAVVTGNQLVFHASGVEQQFHCSARQGFTSYLGIPIPDSHGRVIGHLAFQGPDPIEEEMAPESIYRIFVARAAAELERRQAQRVLLEMATGLSQAKDEASFRMMARSFANVTAMREAFVTECLEHAPGQVRMLAWWRDGEFREPIQFELKGSVSEETILQGRICQYDSGVSRYFSAEAHHGWETYLGVPFFDSAGHVAGHFAAVDTRALQRHLPDSAILRLFCERAAVELARKRFNETLFDAADAISTLRGDACFQAMVRDLCRVLQIREAFVCECVDRPVTRVRMLARWNLGEFAPCVEFDLTGTTCEDVVRDAQPLYVPHGLGERWPLEKQYDRESYLGIPCFDSQRRVIGHIVCTDGKAMPEAAPEWAILKLFAERAAIELERRQMVAQNS